ncbi:hypothetical protein [Alkalihalobacillus pseudalcaliphilus]|uniref:hypothetical protein n=1 Tax=Alkalihalobacillus pseudalcaliphilus TaxID=79884 RepID=UPI00064D9BA9|nr:hypothetical protein [Alkalihalobacillus pseudalcaliphilus]KMK76882.1 hypothetical protein AB990_08295 [Alkalihalobacillus pseudalcaliphilus]
MCNYGNCYYDSESKWDDEPIRCDYDAYSGKYLPRGNSNFVGVSMNGYMGANTLPIANGLANWPSKKVPLHCTELSLRFKENDGLGTIRKLNLDFAECTPVTNEPEEEEENGEVNGNAE